MDVDAINACISTAAAAAKMKQIYEFANASGVTGFPDIRINKKVMPNYFPAFTEELERAICQAYTGVHPKACGPYITAEAAVRQW